MISMQVADEQIRCRTIDELSLKVREMLEATHRLREKSRQKYESTEAVLRTRERALQRLLGGLRQAESAHGGGQ